MTIGSVARPSAWPRASPHQRRRVARWARSSGRSTCRAAPRTQHGLMDDCPGAPSHPNGCRPGNPLLALRRFLFCAFCFAKSGRRHFQPCGETGDTMCYMCVFIATCSLVVLRTQTFIPSWLWHCSGHRSEDASNLRVEGSPLLQGPTHHRLRWTPPYMRL